MRFAMTLLLVGVTLAVTWAESSESDSSWEYSFESDEGLWAESDQSASLEKVDHLCLLKEITNLIGCFKNGISISTVKCVIETVPAIVKCFSNARIALDYYDDLWSWAASYESQWPYYLEDLWARDDIPRSYSKSP
ncbi:uncharacterized protein LOC114354317 [Ostrinia furnacalis]|uniref:uncharacterized protein LOC114354317 n=1 Tax=Ostrinia furnacalis TaxID=93504 RepID=UPI00103CAD90|nr:uncharacterized protein LOC114354317 [Ostrinia furnacalis]